MKAKSNTKPSKVKQQAAEALAERIKRHALAAETLSHSGRGSRSRDGEHCTKSFIAGMAQHIACLQSYYGRNLFWHLDKLDKAVLHLRQGVNDIMTEDAPGICERGLDDMDERETPEPFPENPGSSFTNASDHPE